MPTISTLTVDVEARTSKFSSGMKVASAGLAGLAAAGVYAFQQFEESDKVARQTDAVLKSTGGSANVTADAVANLAASLSNKSGIDDEVIQSGENMLLTFKNIQNQVGAGNDIFNQAASTATDMAAGMAAASGGQVDMKSATIQLGKALNDPIAGMSALARVGVGFSPVQQKLIQQAVEHGNVLKAQKIILGEVNSQFAGSAAAGKTASATMAVSFGNLAEAIGGVLAPAINAVLGVAITFLTWLTKYPGVLVAVGAAVAILTAAWLAQKAISGIAMVQEAIHTGIIVAQTAAHIAAAAAIGIVTAAQWLWNAAMTANPIGLIIVAVVALVGIIVLLVKHFHLADDIMRVLQATAGLVWGAIKAVVGAVVTAVVGYIKMWLAVARFVFNAIRTVALAVWNAIKTAWQAARSFFSGIWDFVKSAASTAWNNIKGNVLMVWTKIKSVWSSAKGFFSGIWNGILDAAKGPLNGLIALWNATIGAIAHGQTISAGPLHVTLPDLRVASLYEGGLVAKTGLAIVHEGEQFSGVGHAGDALKTAAYRLRQIMLRSGVTKGEAQGVAQRIRERGADPRFIRTVMNDVRSELGRGAAKDFERIANKIDQKHTDAGDALKTAAYRLRQIAKIGTTKAEAQGLVQRIKERGADPRFIAQAMRDIRREQGKEAAERFERIANKIDQKHMGQRVEVHVHGSVISEHDLAETVQKALLRSKKRSGALGLA